jgi:hypothetical protein
MEDIGAGKLTAEAEVVSRCAQENEFLSAYTPPV